jgi:aspartate aminotransferase
MSDRLARRLDGIAASAMITLSGAVARMRAEGGDLVGLTAGEPDLAPPPHIVEAVCAAVRAGDLRYAPPQGVLALRRAICAKLARDNRLDCSPDNIVVASGSKQAIYAAFAATIDRGDEIVVAAPYFPAYADIARLHGGVPVVVRPRDPGHRMIPQELAAALGPRTRWVVVNAPSNPSGVAYDQAALAGFAAVLEGYPRALVMTDDIYEHLLFDGRQFATLPSVDRALARRTLIVNGLSKAYAIPGLRIGYAAGPAWLIEGMIRILSHSTSCASTIGQAAAVAALDGPQESVAAHRAIYERRRNRLVAGLDAIDGLSCLSPDGALYALADARALLGRVTPDGAKLGNDSALAAWLVTQGVALVPGSAFDAPGYLRATFAVADADIEAALARLAAACGRLK